MAFQVSPGVLVKEKDLTNVIPAVATSIGAIGIQSTKGPVDEVVSVSSEKELVETQSQIKERKKHLKNKKGELSIIIQSTEKEEKKLFSLPVMVRC